MGEKRFLELEVKLPPGTTILGIDEQAACSGSVLQIARAVAYNKRKVLPGLLSELKEALILKETKEPWYRRISP